MRRCRLSAAVARAAATARQERLQLGARGVRVVDVRPPAEDADVARGGVVAVEALHLRVAALLQLGRAHFLRRRAVGEVVVAVEALHLRVAALLQLGRAHFLRRRAVGEVIEAGVLPLVDAEEYQLAQRERLHDVALPQQVHHHVVLQPGGALVVVGASDPVGVDLREVAAPHSPAGGRHARGLDHRALVVRRRPVGAVVVGQRVARPRARDGLVALARALPASYPVGRVVDHRDPVWRRLQLAPHVVLHERRAQRVADEHEPLPRRDEAPHVLLEPAQHLREAVLAVQRARRARVLHRRRGHVSGEVERDGVEGGLPALEQLVERDPAAVERRVHEDDHIVRRRVSGNKCRLRAAGVGDAAGEVRPVGAVFGAEEQRPRRRGGGAAGWVEREGHRGEGGEEGQRHSGKAALA
eukprot:CAMPEP_0184403192 /NCGR_PEP_ID=MMETSP0007-20130409/85283_1 /TAXON_ID=97485 /ORGANISM="Prymnesium parvum, Strain Texoma1" /LENGTH=412 /DNA_ID=CAMNT_0026759281 /DNA_START=296 /DNA_END=1531 /DNA_ORIENTATION=-